LRERARRPTEHASDIVAMRKDVLARQTSKNIVSMVASNPLRTVIPENNLPLTIDHVNSGLETVQNNPKNLWTLKFRHSGLHRNFIGKLSFELQTPLSATNFRIVQRAEIFWDHI
jgi:hypothetical protein